MNKNFDFNSKKYIILLILICVLFTIIVIKAFDYLPASDQKYSDENAFNNINKPAVTETKITEDESEKISLEQPNKTLNIELPKYGENIGLEDINEVEDDISTPELDKPVPLAEKKKVVSETKDKATAVMEKAKMLFDMQDYQNALAEYQRIPTLTTEPAIVAQSYEEIAIIYAKSKKYGTALVYASKAYNTKPTAGREFLISKIYYKAGETQTASNRINDLLQRDF